ncbi:hypothetical protein [Streptomyces pinistramenti]|uniref:hypothetical protein n=1 Tax=Streptomyces pinistramenti TaxID=2884812 RepID=UPI001D07F223|nr:hypothetical protein [Streptomyces pinistramenti]MCB5905905.1 hypothetical protein [Streptomyces pinistramenti]
MELGSCAHPAINRLTGEHCWRLQGEVEACLSLAIRREVSAETGKPQFFAYSPMRKKFPLVMSGSHLKAEFAVSMPREIKPSGGSFAERGRCSANDLDVLVKIEFALRKVGVAALPAGCDPIVGLSLGEKAVTVIAAGGN